MNTNQEKVSEIFIDSFDDNHHPLFAFKYYSHQLGVWLKNKPMNYSCAKKYRESMIKEYYCEKCKENVFNGIYK